MLDLKTPPFSSEDGQVYHAISTIFRYKDGARNNLRNNLEHFSSEGFRALKVLCSIEAESWFNIHEQVQSAKIKYEPCISHLFYASNVIAAIERNDEVEVLRSLIKMIDAVDENKKVKTELTLLKQEEHIHLAGYIIKSSKKAIRKGIQSIKAGKTGLDCMQKLKPPVTEVEAKAMLNDCLLYAITNPNKTLTEIRKHTARKHKRSWFTVRDHTKTLKSALKSINQK